MIVEASQFVFQPPKVVTRARRILIKPCACSASPYPASTSKDLLVKIIEGIRQVSDADILILEGTPNGDPVTPFYQALEYSFPRVIMLDAKDCTTVEVDNPLPKHLAIPTFKVPNVILSSDYLISVAPLKISNNRSSLSITNLLTALPINKYQESGLTGWEALYSLGMDKVITDLYFTVPFDLGIIEARQRVSASDQFSGGDENCGKVFIGEPFQVDCEAVSTLGLQAEYLNLIREAKIGFE